MISTDGYCNILGAVNGAASRHGNTSYVSLLLAEGSDPWKAERVICEGFSLVSRWVVALSQALSSREVSSPAGVSGRLSPPRIVAVSNVDRRVDVCVVLRELTLVVRTPELVAVPVPDVAALVTRLTRVLRSNVANRKYTTCSPSTRIHRAI